MLTSFTYKPIAPGYMFMIPRVYADDSTIAFISLDPRVKLDEVVNYFMKENPFFAAWFKDAEWIQQLAFSQYIFTPVTTPYKDRVLLAGDTGSSQELENSGAMISGWKAGNAVAGAVKEEKVGTIGSLKYPLFTRDSSCCSLSPSLGDGWRTSIGRSGTYRSRPAFFFLATQHNVRCSR